MDFGRLTPVRESLLLLPAVPVGPPSAFPDLATGPDAPVDVGPLGENTVDLSGAAANVFPYRPLEKYGREARAREFRSVVLENDRLRAEFLPELGGRLWSLVDRTTGRDLLHTPDRVQLANLALRNAWFCGGIEFNIGTRGHAAYTCEPIGAGRVVGPGGESLRLWEFDRLREVVFQIDVCLPASSSALVVGVRIVNPNAGPTPMYWWTNAAVPQTDSLRVLAPAPTAILTDDKGRLRRVDLTGPDATRRVTPASARQAFDLFFENPPAERPWIAAVDESGSGLAVVSGARARGRKLFGWGTGPGGKRWQNWLSPGGGHYCEIQSGLARTQYEHPTMPGGSSWSWVESYGPIRLDPVVALDADHAAAVRHAAAVVDRDFSAGDLVAAEQWHQVQAGRPVDTVWHPASPWGTLERLRRVATGTGWVDEAVTPFPAQPGVEQAYWTKLLTGAPAGEQPEIPDSFVRGPDWERALRAVPPDATSTLHLGLMALARGAVVEAEGKLRDSLGFRGRPWTRYFLAITLLQRGDTGSAVGELVEAGGAGAGDPDLVQVVAVALLRAGAPEKAHRVLDTVPAGARTPRLELLALACLAAMDRRDELREGLAHPPVVPDIREGETSLAALWRLAHPNEPVPPELDFRMHGDVPTRAG